MAPFFDGSVLDLWLPLTMGCAAVFAPAEDMKNPVAVRDLLQQHSIASIMMVPSMFQVRWVSG